MIITIKQMKLQNNLQIFLTINKNNIQSKQQQSFYFLIGPYKYNIQDYKMFGSLKQFIEVDLPLINSKMSTQQNQEDKVSVIDQFFKKKVESSFHEYLPSDKTTLLTRFNMRNQTQKKTSSLLQQNKSYRSESERKPLVSHTSFFGKNQLTKNYIAKSQLKRKHNLLRAIVRTNQNENENEGVSDYDQSFKRLYEKFQSVYSKPILEYRNFVIDESFEQLPSQPSVQTSHKPMRMISNRKRIEYENCLNWAKKHKKKSQFYENQLGKHLKEKKQENINMGHSMMPEVQRKIRTLSHNSRWD